MVKILKTHMGPTGFVHAGADIELDDTRHRALARNGIVDPPEGVEPPKRPEGVKHAITNSDIKPRREKLTLPKADPVGQAATGGPAKGK